MIGFVALLVSSLVAWLTHVLMGAHVSMFTDFAVSTVTGMAYVMTFYWLKKLRGGF